jgi:hypothetical protein
MKTRLVCNDRNLETRLEVQELIVHSTYCQDTRKKILPNKCEIKCYQYRNSFFYVKRNQKHIKHTII